MKKLFTLLLAVAGMVSTASAWPDDLYLICNENNEWAVDGDAYNTTFSFTKTSDNNFRATVPGSYIHSGNWRFRFRVKDSEWWNIGPNTNSDVDVTTSSYFSTQKGYNGITEAFYVAQNASAKYIHVYCTWNGSSGFTVSTEVITAETNYSIAFTNPSDWADANVKAYAFIDGLVLSDGWPGSLMAKEDGIYKMSFNGTNTPCIIFSNNGNNQTSDLNVVNDAVYDTDGLIADQSVTVSTYGMSTFCSEYPLDFSTATPSGLTAYIITGANKATGSLTATPVTKVPAGTGVYIEGAANQVYSIKPTATAEDAEDNMLIGVTANTNIGQTTDSYTNYILTVNKSGGDVGTPKFFKVNIGGNTVLANKAYLQILTANATARESFWFGEEATAIDAMQQEPTMDGQAFNLAGQRIAQPAKGLYIVNGKKFIKK